MCLPNGIAWVFSNLFWICLMFHDVFYLAEIPMPWGTWCFSILQGIHVSSRAGCLRIAPHLYNDEADIDALLNALGELQESSTLECIAVAMT